MLQGWRRFTPTAVRKTGPSLGPKKSSRERGESSDSSSVTGVGVVGDGEFVAMGTLPTSSGRSEGEVVVRLGPEDSDVAVRSVTDSELVSAEAAQLNISMLIKKLPQKGRSIWNSLITKQIQVSTKKLQKLSVQLSITFWEYEPFVSKS